MHNTVYYTHYSVHFVTGICAEFEQILPLLYGIRTNVWDRYFLCADGVVCSQRRIVCISLHCLHAEQSNTDPIDIAAADDMDVNNRRKSKRKPRRRGGVFCGLEWIRCSCVFVDNIMKCTSNTNRAMSTRLELTNTRQFANKKTFKLIFKFEWFSGSKINSIIN